jgi:steroid delta-isomerase
MLQHAADWIAAWNRRDLDAVLRVFSETARFTSPKALAIAGSATLEGKVALAAYWREGLRRLSTIEFRLDHVLCDVERREMVVVYEANLNGHKTRASEFMRFDSAGRQVEGEVMYGVPAR